MKIRVNQIMGIAYLGAHPGAVGAPDALGVAAAVLVASVIAALLSLWPRVG